MNFNKLKIMGVSLLMATSLMALDNKEISQIDRIMNEGVLINKTLKSDSKVELKLFKALTKDTEATALLKIKNLTDAYINVKDFVDYGQPIKPKLAPSELTYILIEDNLEKATKRMKSESILEERLKDVVKNSYPMLKKYISDSVNIYNVVQNERGYDEYDLNKVYITDYIDFMDTVKKMDYYSYLKTNIQNSLYHGYYFAGYEQYNDGSAKARSYYFITDEISNKISMIYILNDNIKYKDFKDIIMNKIK